MKQYASASYAADRKYYQYFGYSTYNRNDINSEILSKMINSKREFNINNIDEIRIHVRARFHTVFLTKKAANFKLSHGLDDYKYNKNFWQNTKFDYNNSTNIIPYGVSSKAMRDMFRHPDQYTIGCRDAAIWTLKYGTYLATGGTNLKLDDPVVDDSDWIPGENGFIENDNNIVKFLAYTQYLGENIIYIGNNNFWGLATNKEKQINTMEGWFNVIKQWAWSGHPKLHKYRGRSQINVADL
ncbi:hypothetical protein HY772_08140 [Candidatus Woesearchaeota archaeon]|nr:hypothetical protein [Candidatus Woesearchaeota archaeon]